MTAPSKPARYLWRILCAGAMVPVLCVACLAAVGWVRLVVREWEMGTYSVAIAGIGVVVSLGLCRRRCYQFGHRVLTRPDPNTVKAVVSFHAIALALLLSVVVIQHASKDSVNLPYPILQLQLFLLTFLAAACYWPAHRLVLSALGLPYPPARRAFLQWAFTVLAWYAFVAINVLGNYLDSNYQRGSIPMFPMIFLGSIVVAFLFQKIMQRCFRYSAQR
jgi:hypothetical protein